MSAPRVTNPSSSPPPLRLPAIQLRLFVEPDEVQAADHEPYPISSEGVPSVRLSQLVPLYIASRQGRRGRPLAPATCCDLRLLARHWAAAVGDPPLSAVVEWHTRSYAEWLASRGLAAATIATRMNYLRILLRFARPQGDPRWPFGLFGFFHAAAEGAICSRIPREPPAVSRPVAIDGAGEAERPGWGAGEVAAFRASCGWARWPRRPGCQPAQWWRSAIDVVAGTGIRRRTLLALQRSWLRPAAGGWVLDLPAAALKGHRRAMIYANRLVRDAIAAIPDWPGEADRPLFALPGAGDLGQLTRLHGEFRRILLYVSRASISLELRKRAGFHTLRRGLGDRLYAEDPQAAQETLGHRSATTTRDHYTQLTTRAMGQAERLERLAEEMLSHRASDPDG